MTYEIMSDPATMTIRVGSVVFDKPLLNMRTELDFSVKEAVCDDAPPAHDVVSKHKFFSSRLGPKFNRRFQAANYWLWIGNALSPVVANMLRHGRKAWRHYDEDLVVAAHAVLPIIKQAESDGLLHLVPAIVLFGASPEDIRKKIGGAVWKRIAHNSRTRNMRLMQTARSIGRKRVTEQFVRLLDFPSGVLNAVHGTDPEAELIAARISPRKTPIVFQQTTHVVRDTMRMLGDGFNPEWGLARMRREHDAAAHAARSRQYSSEPFADAWRYEAGGYTADLLVSPLAVAVEGDTQHHCVGSYAGLAKRGEYAVLQIDGTERATAGYQRDAKGWRLDQVYGACNAPVSNSCHAFAHAAGLALRVGHVQRRAA